MAIKDKVREFLNAKINQYKWALNDTRRQLNRPIQVSPTVRKGLEFGANFATSFAKAMPGNVNERIQTKLGIPQYDMQTKAGKAGNVVGNVASNLVQTAALGKLISPAFSGVQKPLGTLAGKIIPKSKFIGKGIANLSQGLPYTTAFNVLNKVENPDFKTDVRGDLAFDFATGMVPLFGVGGSLIAKQAKKSDLISILRSGKGTYDAVSGQVKIVDGAGNLLNVGRLSKKIASNALDLKPKKESITKLSRLSDTHGKEYMDEGNKLLGGIQKSIQQKGSVGGVEKRYNLGREALLDPSSQGYKDIRGGSANTPEEVASLIKDFRNPKEEVMHLVFTKNGKVVGHNAVTSKVVDGVKIDPKEMLYGIGDRAGRLNADGIYIAHNHPSGEPDISAVDTAVFKQLRKRFGNKVKALVATDHDAVGVAEMKNGKLNDRIARLDMGKSFKSTGEPITNKVVLEGYAREYYKPDGKSIGAFIVDSQGRPVAYEKFNGVGKGVDSINNTVRQFARKNRGANVFLVMPDEVARTINPSDFPRIGAGEVLINRGNVFENAGHVFNPDNLKLDRNLGKNKSSFLFDNPKQLKVGDVKPKSLEAGSKLELPKSTTKDTLPAQISNAPSSTNRTTQSLTAVQPQANVLKNKIEMPVETTGGGLGKGNGPINSKISPIKPSSDGSISDSDLISRLNKTLKEAKPLRNAQEALYSKERGRKFAKLMATRERIGGEKGFYSELGALKGELPKVEYESIRQNFDQKSVDRLFNIVKENKVLDDWDKVNAQIGLAKVLGESGGGVPTKGELEKLYEVFGEEFTQNLLNKRPLMQRLGDVGMQLYNLPRSFMAGVADFSGTLMQNALFAYRHPILTAKNFTKQLQFFGSEKVFKMSQEEIASRPNFKLMKEAKLSLTDTGPLVSKREEQFMASIAEKIPGFGRIVKATGRAYTGFLNRMRADVFDQMVESYKKMGGDVSPKYLKDLGDFINTSTGRGSLGQFERVAPVLGQGFFSARKLVATVQTLNPMYYINKEPQIRKEALLTMLSFMGGATLITQLSRLAGADVEDDPTSADFGKIKIGNTRFNMYGPYQQIAVLFGRLWKGYATSTTTGKKMMLGDESNPYSPTRLDLLTRYFESKEHPTLSYIVSALRGTNNIGEKFNPTTEALNRFVPMILADSYDLYKEHGPIGLLGSIPAILGIPAQTYGRQYPTMGTTKTGKPKIEMKNETGIVEDVVNKVTGTPKSNIPQNQWQGIVDTKKSEAEERAVKDTVRESGEAQKTESKYIYYDKDSDEVKSINLNPDLTPPELTGQTDLDKEILSDYKSSLSRRINDIVKLYELGQMSSEEAEKEIGKISTLKEVVSRINKKPKKLSIKRGTVPKIRKTSSKKISLKTVRPSGKARFNVKTKKQPTYKVSQADLEKLRQGKA